MYKENLEVFSHNKQIPSEVLLLEEVFDIAFETPPESRNRSLISTHREMSKLVDDLQLTGRLKYAMKFLAFGFIPILHFFTGGHYSVREKTFYISRTTDYRSNIYGEYRISPEAYHRCGSLHELTHGYIEEQDNDKGRFLLEALNMLREHRIPPNFEQPVTGSIWNEGVCEFASIFVEEELVRLGLVEPDESESMTRKHYFLTGRRRLDIKKDSQEPKQYYDDQIEPEEEGEIDFYNRKPDIEWLMKLNKLLEQASIELSNINIAKSFDLSPNSALLELMKVKLPEGLKSYAIGYLAAAGAFRALRANGLSTPEAFQHMCEFVPERIYDLMHPESYVRFTVHHSKS